jgi:hypothetical protein
MDDRYDNKNVLKLMSFLEDLPFYQINLCPDIDANLKCLQEFIEGIDK